MHSTRRIPTPLLVLFIAFAVAGTPGAEGHDLTTLWELSSDSSIIVVADVVGTELLEPPEPEVDSSTQPWLGYSSLAYLEVLGTWKGRSSGRLVVAYDMMLECPAAARFDEGKTVLAFLQETDGILTAVGECAGTLYPDSKGRRVFKERVLSALKLQRDLPVSASNYTDWLVDTASQPATRRHGVTPLIEADPPVMTFTDSAEDPGGDYGEAMEVISSTCGQELVVGSAAWEPLADPPEPVLLPVHLERIADSLLAFGEVDESTAWALQLLKDYPSEEIDYFAVAACEAVLLEDQLPDWHDLLLSVVLGRFGATEDDFRTDALLPEFEPWLEPPTYEEFVSVIWRFARERFAIPDAAPAILRDGIDGE